MRRNFLSYTPKLKQIAKNLRNHSTLAEVILWHQLKNKQIQGFDFHRQKPIDNYIVDFYCLDLMLVIEVDGSTHGDKINEDDVRQKKLESLGVSFLRFSDYDIKKNLDSVIERINDWVEENK